MKELFSIVNYGVVGSKNLKRKTRKDTLGRFCLSLNNLILKSLKVLVLWKPLQSFLSQKDVPGSSEWLGSLVVD